MTSENTTERRNILLIDDDTSLLMTLGDFLRYEGYDVETAESGEAGLEALRRLQPDLILLDMSMPGMGGVAFLERITDAEGKVRYPVLVLTARAHMADFFARTQVDGFVAKPCDPDDLLMEIGRILFLRGVEAVAQEGTTVENIPTLLLCDPDAERNAALHRALSEDGFDVDSVFQGPDLIENAIVRKPAVLAMHFDAGAMKADVVLSILRKMPTTQRLPVVVYGLGDAGLRSDLAAALEEHQAYTETGTTSSDVVHAVRRAVPAGSV